MRLTAGVWEPTEPGQLFLVANGRHREVAHQAGCGFLITISDIPRDTTEMKGRCQMGPVLLDSGVFPFASEIAAAEECSVNEVFNRRPADLPGHGALVEMYERVIGDLGELSWGYVEIDLGDWKEKTAMRQRLEADGLGPIPVYHCLTDPPEYFDDLCREYDRVCIGNLARSPRAIRERMVAACMARRESLGLNTWLHGLGWGITESLIHYPIESVDAVTWVRPGKYRLWPTRGMAKSIGHIEDRFMTFRSSDAYWGVMMLSAEGFRFARDAWRERLYERARPS